MNHCLFCGDEVQGPSTVCPRCFWSSRLQKPSTPLASLQKEIHENAMLHGWWGADPNIAEKLALVHSEVSEALEDYRDGRMEEYYKGDSDKPEGFPVELADAVIRILDLAEHLNIDLMGVILRKHEYNKTRTFRHGGKRA